MKTILFAALAVAASASVFVSAKQIKMSRWTPFRLCRCGDGRETLPRLMRPSISRQCGERFASVNLGEGQNLRAVVLNVLIPDADESRCLSRGCAVL